MPPDMTDRMASSTVHPGSLVCDSLTMTITPENADKNTSENIGLYMPNDTFHIYWSPWGFLRAEYELFWGSTQAIADALANSPFFV